MNRIEEKNKQAITMVSIKSFTDLLITDLLVSGRHSTARSYSCSLKRLTDFVGDANLTFPKLTAELPKCFEQQLFSENCARNTVSSYMRMLRSICNQARNCGKAKIPRGLFDNVFTGTDPSEKRAVSPGVIRSLSEADLSASPQLDFCRDLFLLSFYLRGIPFVDLIHLRKRDITNGTLRYRRSKTDRLLTVKVEPCAQALFNKYSCLAKHSPYLLPVITSSGIAGYRQYQSALRRYNQHLARLSVLLRLKMKLTSYVARHSWATIAYRQGIPVSVISESLGHASEKITYTYLASFDNRTLNRANRKVIALVAPMPSVATVMGKRKAFQQNPVNYG